jgi:hypothetical protein
MDKKILNPFSRFTQKTYWSKRGKNCCPRDRLTKVNIYGNPGCGRRILLSLEIPLLLLLMLLCANSILASSSSLPQAPKVATEATVA